jgi:hypothetical protein
MESRSCSLSAVLAGRLTMEPVQEDFGAALPVITLYRVSEKPGAVHTDTIRNIVHRYMGPVAAPGAM